LEGFLGFQLQQLANALLINDGEESGDEYPRKTGTSALSKKEDVQEEAQD
jgi:hypothetical protein